jgi:hypothetical protein
VNATVTAYVDPSLPDKAYLIATAGNGAVVFMVLGVLLPPIAWWVRKYVCQRVRHVAGGSHETASGARLSF